MAQLHIPVESNVVKDDRKMSIEFFLFLQQLIQQLGGGGGGTLKQATITLTDADIKTSQTIYPLVVAAPGAGKYLVVHRWALAISTTVAYTNVETTDALNGFTVAYGDWTEDASTMFPLWGLAQAGPRVIQFLGTGMIVVPSAAQLSAVYPSYSGGPNGIADVTNLPLKLVCWNNSLGDFTGGDPANRGTLTVYYTIEAI